MSPRARSPLRPPAFSRRISAKDVLRFITCGSVDDGKSTLIGRLLHDTRQLFDDQLAALEARFAQARHARAGPRFCAPRRRPLGRARAGHHHRRRLSLLLDRDAHLHRRRHARPRAVHAQHGDWRLDGGARGASRRRPQGSLAADPPPHASSCRCSASATSCSPSTRWTSSAGRRTATRRSWPSIAPSRQSSALRASPACRSPR